MVTIPLLPTVTHPHRLSTSLRRSARHASDAQTTRHIVTLRPLLLSRDGVSAKDQYTSSHHSLEAVVIEFGLPIIIKKRVSQYTVVIHKREGWKRTSCG